MSWRLQNDNSKSNLVWQPTEHILMIALEQYLLRREIARLNALIFDYDLLSFAAVAFIRKGVYLSFIQIKHYIDWHWVNC